MIDPVRLKKDGLEYLLRMRISPDRWAWRFSDTSGETLIASSLAGMLAGAVGWIGELEPAERAAWSDYLNSFQLEDGFFADDDIEDANRVPGYTRERALFHRTRHALFALSALGYRPRRRFAFLDPFLTEEGMRDWLSGLDLSNYWDASNKMMDLAIFLTFEKNTSGVPRRAGAAASSLEALLDFCDAETDPRTGYHDGGRSETRNAMAGAMHLYPVYFLEGRPPLHPERVVETTLGLQQSDGLYSYEVGSGGEDCLDYDAVLILVNFFFRLPAMRPRILASLQRTVTALEVCRNPDLGYCCHRRPTPYRFGTFTTEVPIGGSSLWATYSRLLTVAMADMAMTAGSDPKRWSLGANLMEVWDGGTGLMIQKPDFIGLAKG